jgi:hypothetical protein
VDPKDLIRVPESAQSFAAHGAVQFGLSEEEGVGAYRGMDNLRRYIDVGRLEEKQAAGGKGLAEDAADLDAFGERFRPPVFREPFAPRRSRGDFVGWTAAPPPPRPSCSTGPERPGEELSALRGNDRHLECSRHRGQDLLGPR